jgi:DNA modification methylase
MRNFDCQEENATHINFNKFKAVFNGDEDNKNYERSFSGRLTPKRYKLLERFCRKNTYSSRCYHKWDCCGCLCRQDMSIIYKHNRVTITLVQSFNY